MVLFGFPSSLYALGHVLLPPPISFWKMVNYYTITMTPLFPLRTASPNNHVLLLLLIGSHYAPVSSTHSLS